MQNKNLSELSLQELQKRKKTSRLITGMLIGAICALFVLNLTTIILENKDWGGIAVPLALSPIAILNYKSLKEIEKELKLRKVY